MEVLRWVNAIWTSIRLLCLGNWIWPLFFLGNKYFMNLSEMIDHPGCCSSTHVIFYARVASFLTAGNQYWRTLAIFYNLFKCKILMYVPEFFNLAFRFKGLNGQGLTGFMILIIIRNATITFLLAFIRRF
jgi:hypothetical protein